MLFNLKKPAQSPGLVVTGFDLAKFELCTFRYLGSFLIRMTCVKILPPSAEAPVAEMKVPKIATNLVDTLRTKPGVFRKRTGSVPQQAKSSQIHLARAEGDPLELEMGWGK